MLACMSARSEPVLPAGLNPDPTVEVLYSAGAELGECPVYDDETGTLIWVNVDEKTINFLDPIAKTNKYYS